MILRNATVGSYVYLERKDQYVCFKIADISKKDKTITMQHVGLKTHEETVSISIFTRAVNDYDILICAEDKPSMEVAVNRGGSSKLPSLREKR